MWISLNHSKGKILKQFRRKTARVFRNTSSQRLEFFVASSKFLAKQFTAILGNLPLLSKHIAKHLQQKRGFCKFTQAIVGKVEN